MVTTTLSEIFAYKRGASEREALGIIKVGRILDYKDVGENVLKVFLANGEDMKSFYTRGTVKVRKALSKF